MISWKVLALAGTTAATNIFVPSYAGSVTTLSLTETNGSYGLTFVDANGGCGLNPAWLALDSANGIVYCIDEGINVDNGTLTSFLAFDNGTLSVVQQEQTPQGGVAAVIYGDAATGHRGIVVAHYEGSAMTSWAIGAQNRGQFSHVQTDLFTMNQSGPNANRQDAPHLHHAILDPTGQFVLTPDLGADLVRVFSIDTETLELTTETPLSVASGSGPRHAAFYQPYGVDCESCTSFLFVVAELANTVTSYAVSYPTTGGMEFQKVYESSTYGNMTTPSGNAAAEIHISADNRFLVISNRNNTSFQIANPDPTNSTMIASDSLSTFQLNVDGTLDFVQLAASGGKQPRQFSMNKIGDLVAVGLQYSSAVVILKRDTVTGLIGEEVARHYIEGEVTGAWWQE